MEIKTEKTHTIVLSDDELNQLRCFIGEALHDHLVWDIYPEDQNNIETVYSQFLKATTGVEK